MFHDQLSKKSFKYILSSSLTWAIVLPAGTIVGWIVGILLSRLQSFPWYIESDWSMNGSMIGFILGGALGGAFTIHGLRRWIPEINRKQLLVTGFGWALALASQVILYSLLVFD